jgi:hypothetical protein
MTTLIDDFQPLLAAAQGVELDDAESAKAALEAAFDPKGAEAAEVNRRLLARLAAGELAQKGAMPVRFGRVTKACPESRGFSIDVVVMNGAGPRHHHPLGEINYCVAVEGEPRFENEPPGWVVLPSESTHVPTVRGGTMLIAYLLPQGKIEFLEQAG